MDICKECKKRFKPRWIKKGLWEMRRFKGYTVDLRLHEFRRAVPGKLTFTDFDSPKGRKLLAQMHKQTTEMHTNKTWYPYKSLGGYFKLEEGTLMGCAMNADGTQEDNPYEVDWYEAWDNDVKPEEIIQELESKE